VRCEICMGLRFEPTTTVHSVPTPRPTSHALGLSIKPISILPISDIISQIFLALQTGDTLVSNMVWSDLPTWQLVLLTTFGYVLLCRALRFRRLRQKEALYPYKNRESFAKMTTQHAYEIQKYLITVEFPFTAQKALEFALFRLVQ
jgi:hypothetical protein